MATPKKKEGRSKSFSMRYRVEEVPMATSEIHRNIPENESFNKDTGVHKYLKMIKPLYAKASKIRFFDQLSPRKQQGSRASSVFREVCRNLAKSDRLSEYCRCSPRREGEMIQRCNNRMVYKAQFFTARDRTAHHRRHQQYHKNVQCYQDLQVILRTKRH